MTSFSSPLAAMTANDLNTICASSGFQILRRYLEDDVNNCFCTDHDDISTTEQDQILLHRDILHAMVMPVVQLLTQASTLASAALCSSKPEDLELAFRGEARDAFVWLQVFFAEEKDWSYTRGCPACVVANTLRTESTIRAAITAVLLSSTEPITPCRDEEDDEHDNQDNGGLPDLSAVIPALEHAVDTDEFWGPTYFEHLYDRAERTCTGIQDLIYQCTNLEALVISQPPSPSETPLRRISVAPSPCTMSPLSSSPTSTRNTIPIVLTSKTPKQEEMKLRKGQWARRQSRLKHEERELILKAAWDAWAAQQAALVAQAKQQPWLLGDEAKKTLLRPRQVRRRTLTCP